ncbi:MAG: hypothetical protein L0Y76_04405 [Ignavibacteria bacterium]|nr:hypothetical protein [Ignavibacteria bacterium]
MVKKDKPYIYFLFFVFLLTRIFLLIRPFPEIDSYVLTDDTFLSLKIAKNIADGYGMTYGGIPTNGFQPLYVFMMVPVFAIIKSSLILPVYIAMILLTVFSLLSAVVLYRLILRLFGSSESAFIVSLLFVITPALIRNMTNGLETSVSFFFFLLTVYLLYIYRETSLVEIKFKKIFLFGLILGFAVLARIDNIFLFLMLFIWFVFKFGREKPGIKTVIYCAIAFTAGFAVIYAPWLAVSYFNTGMLYPVSGEAVRIQGIYYAIHRTSLANFYISELYRSLRYFVLNYFVVVFLIIALLPFVFKKRGFGFLRGFISSKHFPLVVTSVLFYAVYVFYISAFWYFPRYLVPLFVPVSFLTGFLVKEMFAHGLFRGKRNLFFIAITAIFILINVLRPGFRDYFFGKHVPDGYYGISVWVSGNLKEGSRIGSLQTGALAYFAENVEVYNLDGVVNANALNAIKQNRLIDYIKENKLEYVLLWNINHEFIKAKSANFLESDLTHLRSIEGIKSWGYEWDLYKVNY